MKNLFNSVKMTRPNSNVFDLSHDVKLSLNMGELVPIMVMECVPGDKVSLSCESLLRFAPLISPVMHRMDVTMHYFFCPNRILWPNWEKFITNTPNPTVLPAFPYVTIGNTNWSSLADYLGIPPTSGTNQENVSALPFAAYQKIYNEYYRDQNLITELNTELVDGSNNGNNPTLLALRKRAWEHDYFTAALPFAQKGQAVTIPIGGFNDVPLVANPPGTGQTATTITGTTQPGNINTGFMVNTNTGSTTVPDGALWAKTSDLQQSTSTINDLRRAYRLQEWLEKAARGGSRYIENILMHFGVKSSDKRLQRPEYITGTKSPVVISEVLNTAATSGTNDGRPQGDMAGHGVSVTSGKYGSYFCEEHGYVIGIMSVMPKTAYQQGIPKHFLKTKDPFQYYWPSFANIGEQEVLNREVYAFNGTTYGDGTFGYVPRYAEYKFIQNRVAGDFRDDLSFWHLGRIFSTPPALNQAFIECTPRTDIFAVEDPAVQKLYAHVFNKVKAVRRMPKYGTPQF